MFLSKNWKNFENLKKDRTYLIKVYEKLLKILSKKLNHEFKLNKPLIYWRIILGPWLIFYLVSNYNRWLITKNQKKQILKKLQNFRIKDNLIFVNYDINDFYQKSKEDDDYFNSSLLRIINPNKLYNIGKSEKFNLNFKRKNSKKKLIHYFDLILSYISLFFSKYLIDIQYFPKTILFKLFFYSKIFPALHRLNLKDFERERTNFNQIKRNNFFKIKKNYNFDKFEKFIFKNFTLDYPIQYFEFFEKNRKKIMFLSSFPKKVIITMTSHMFNEKFKFYLAEMISKKSKLIIIEHGGCLNYKFDSFFDHEDKICYKKVIWDKSSNKSKIQLPVVQLLAYKNIVNKKPKKILILFCEILKFPMKIQCLPYNIHRSQEIQNIENILNKISTKYHSDINFRYSSIMNEENDFIINYLKNRFPKINFYNFYTAPPLQEDLSRSRIVICTNPETTLAQCIISKRPTLLYLDKNHYKFCTKSNKMLKLLKKEKIYFDNPNSLGNFINKISINSINNSFIFPKNKKILQTFETNFFNIDKDWLNKWKNFLINLC